MARPSAESSPTTEGGGAPLSAHDQGHRSTPTPFLTKTYQLVDEPSIDDVISWNKDGTTFIVWRPAEFAGEVLPKYFKHNNFSSFVRQLNTYGFRKIVPDRWEFANDFFRRGEKRLLCEIHRRKISSSTAAPSASPVIPAGSPVNSGEEQVITTIPLAGGAQPAEESSGAATVLVEENDRLRRENKSLCRELSQMKNLCNNILNLMSKYAPSCRHNVAANIGTTASPPDLATSSPMEQDDSDEAEMAAPAPSPPPPPPVGKKAEGFCSTTTRLFGVSIGFKRNRVESGASSKSEADVKREPMDLDGGGES
ncbi:heat stress transcription factor B-2b-like [Curcuma longa]|uniref:heat stress transcription factor B-2b-like n=1 Tax=Curcuma longa TaxID=136217 RepID=UPI003D9F7DF2